MNTISWGDFEKVDIRVGTITSVDDFPEARKPAFKLTIDFGPLGTRKSSAQITKHYTKDSLIGRQVVGVINFPPKQIGPFISEVLVTGFDDGEGGVILVQPTQPVQNGMKLF